MSNSESRKKTKHIMVRVTPEEKAAIEAKARDVNLSAPAFLVAAGLGRQTRSKVEEHLINELRRLGGLQKHLFTEGGGLLSREYSEILVAIRDAIQRIAGSPNDR
ncbi:plasmid mobilization protein MobA [Achromobacter insuavis]|uniref:plasmid mobilization protein MobA n=1 Tax=Achromobacter insuavis TaxID=1287735 RepID=UPI001F141E7E|nr:plasmid mobilization protein MobA [Achromobacter insuavis]